MRRAAIAVTALCACLTFPAHATERITDFSSDVRVAQTGALTVTETISVKSEGDSIRHGIFRDFPTTYSKNGRRIRVGFDVLSASLDGHDEPYSVAAIEDGERVKIGDPNTLIAPGPHRFTLTYATDRQIGFFDGYDELYWNVTGNFWKFPIDRAEVRITLPAGAHIMQTAAYTGPAGSTNSNAKVEKLSESVISFSTTGPLGAEEGLTVAVGFSKGAVLPPSPLDLRRAFIRDNAAAVAAAAGVLLMLVYFVIVWIEHGSRSPRSTVIPLFAPPKDFSPAAARFIYRMAYDRKGYAASLVDMAVKGYLKIAETDDVYTLTRTGRTEGATALAHGEAAIAGRLFSDANKIELKQTNHAVVAASISALKTSLTNEYERVYFVTNSHWFAGGLAMLVATAIATGILCDNAATAIFILVWLSGWSIGTAVLIHRAWSSWTDVFSGPGSRALNTLGALFATAFAAPFAAGWLLGFFVLAKAIPAPAAITLSIGGAAVYAFYHLLKHPTLLGAKTLAEIEGFKLFLDTAEKERLEVLNPPNVTPEVFEKFLPYAIALDCENQWSKKFEAQAAAAGIAPDTRGNYYTPGWYSGSSLGRLGSAGFADALGSSMAAAAASAATAPGSSSGSGGGGSSGGGGGGGGGGGW
jgi:uncharacterized membrane protein YgcG